MLITGNKNYGLAKSIYELYPTAEFCSRSSGFELTSSIGIERFAALSMYHDVIIINSALWKFCQPLLLHAVYTANKNRSPKIIVVGSTTDRTTKGTDWLYHFDKKALREMCASLSLQSVWAGGPRVTLVSFGTLENNQHKHPERKVLTTTSAASYIKWIIDSPDTHHINEISVDARQQV